MYIYIKSRHLLINVRDVSAIQISTSENSKEITYYLHTATQSGYQDTILYSKSPLIVEAELARIVDSLWAGNPVHVIDETYINIGLDEASFDPEFNQIIHPEYDLLIQKLKQLFPLLNIPEEINKFELDVVAKKFAKNKAATNIGEILYRSLVVKEKHAESEKREKRLCVVPNCFLPATKGNHIENMLCDEHWEKRVTNE